jgi:hypothetical protein
MSETVRASARPVKASTNTDDLAPGRACQHGRALPLVRVRGLEGERVGGWKGERVRGFGLGLANACQHGRALPLARKQKGHGAQHDQQEAAQVGDVHICPIKARLKRSRAEQARLGSGPRLSGVRGVSLGRTGEWRALYALAAAERHAWLGLGLGF